MTLPPIVERLAVELSLPVFTRAVTASGTAPSARRDMAFGYFQTQNKLVVFGGRGGPITDDTWEFDLGTGEI